MADRAEDPPPLAFETGESVPVCLMRRGRIIINGMLDHALWRSFSKADDASGNTVSCLMVTRRRLDLARRAIGCFQAQSYAHRELVIVDDDEGDQLADHVGQLEDPRIKYLRLPSEGKPLGALRNIAVEAASGRYLSQWDDDDVSHPLRLDLQMAAIEALQAEGCLLLRHTVWWPASERLAFSCYRLWEGSMVCLKDRLRPYLPIGRGEDTPVLADVLSKSRLSLLDLPELYVYTYHQGNTFGEDHFERHWQLATERFEGEAYAAMLAHLRLHRI